jgi:hypothetical protein
VPLIFNVRYAVFAPGRVGAGGDGSVRTALVKSHWVIENIIVLIVLVLRLTIFALSELMVFVLIVFVLR